MDESRIKNILEAALFAAGRPLTLAQMEALFGEDEQPSHEVMRRSLGELIEDYQHRGLVLVEVASGFRIQTAPDTADYISRLWEERPARYSRALLETLSLIAYRQPITRGEIEDVRGVSVSSSIIKTLLEREWVRVLGHRDVPGRPAMYGTTREFLDYFGMKRLNELPPLSELRDIDSINAELDLKMPGEALTEQQEDGEATAQAMNDGGVAEPEELDETVTESETDDGTETSESDSNSSEDEAKHDEQQSSEAELETSEALESESTNVVVTDTSISPESASESAPEPISEPISEQPASESASETTR